MSIPVNITGIGTYFPTKVKTNADYDYKKYGITDEWLNKAGIKERHIAEPEQTIIDLGYQAAKRAIDHANIDPNAIGLLLLATSTFNVNQLVPSGVVNLQKKLGMNNCMSFQISEACCGSLMAMELASLAIMSGQIGHVLVVASETFSKCFNPNSEFNAKIGISMGDSAGAVVLSGNPDKNNKGKRGSYFVSTCDFRTGLVLKPGKAANAHAEEVSINFGFGSLPPSCNGEFLPPHEAINAIKNFTTKALPDAIQNVLTKSEIEMEDIDFFLLHQPNKEFLNEWKAAAKIPPKKTLDTLAKFGNLSSVSVLANLDMAYQLGKINQGDTILLASLGDGINYGAMTWEWTLKPDPKHNYLIKEEKQTVKDKLKTVENYSMLELWEKCIIPGTKPSYSHDELFADFIPSMAIFEGVDMEDAFNFLSKTENLGKWTMSMRNIRPYKGDIYEAEQTASPTGKVFIKTLYNADAKTIEWFAGHESPDDLWIYYKGLLVDAQLAVGRKGSAFYWTNFVHERVKQDPMLAMGFKMMFSAHKIEITNLKMVLEDLYAKKEEKNETCRV